jgi:hypothetical protein
MTPTDLDATGGEVDHCALKEGSSWRQTSALGLRRARAAATIAWTVEMRRTGVASQ